MRYVGYAWCGATAALLLYVVLCGLIDAQRWASRWLACRREMRGFDVELHQLNGEPWGGDVWPPECA